MGAAWIRWARRRLAPALVVACTTIGTLAGAAWAASGWTAYVASYASGTLRPINTATNLAAATGIAVNAAPGAVAIAPNGRTAYVVNFGGMLTPVDVATGKAEKPITFGGDLYGIAIAPNGQTAYVTDQSTTPGKVWPINLGTGAVGTAIPAGVNPESIAITPDGKTAYVADAAVSGTVTPINLATNTAGSPITVGSNASAIAITPDGKTAYVVNVSSYNVTPIDIANNHPGTAIPIGTSYPEQIAIAPDGRTAYVTDYDGTVTAINTANNTTGTPIPVAMYNGQIAITPDGKTAYVVSYPSSGGNSVTPVNLATSTAGLPISVGGNPIGIAITPDQAPIASFSATPGVPGAASTFNGSASSSAVGSVVSYKWSFGDGQSATTTTATTTHVYASPGTYTAGLTVADSAGTSLAQVFTGQTMSLNGGAQASVTHTVTIAAPAVAPTVTHVSQSHSVWREGKALARLARAHAKRPPPVGTKFSFTLSEAAKVKLTFTSKAKHGKGGTLSFSADAGKRKVSFDGRLPAHKKLRPGRYTLTIVAAAAGKSSRPAKLSFTIAR